MLKLAIFWGGALCFLTGCGLLPPHRDPHQPLPPNWDITQEQPPARPAAVPPAVPPETAPVAAPVPPPDLETNQAVTTPSPPADYEETWIGLNHWAEACGLAPAERVLLPPLEMTITNGYQWQSFNLKARASLIPLPTFLLHTTNGVLLIQPETRTAHWDDVEIHLGFTPELVQGEMLVHTLDLSHTIEPLLHGRPALAATNRTIVIDPGDAEDRDDDPDAVARENFALDWAERLAPLLATNGWTVFLTHTNVASVSLAERAAFADMRHPSLFLNLCFGLGKTGEARSGLVTCCLAPASMPDNESAADAEDPWHAFPNNAFDAENLEYAFCLHHFLNDVPDVADCGLRRSRSIDILLDRNCPAVCVSGGNLADPHDAALIASPLFRQALAAAIATALQ